MTMHVRAGGAWQAVQKVYARVSGVWQEVDVLSRVSGAWQTIHENIVSVIGGDWGAYPDPPTTAFALHSATLDPANAAVDVTFNSDGTYDTTEDFGSTTEDWADDAPSTAGGDYQIKWDSVSGDAPNAWSSGWAENTWLSLSAARSVGMSQTSPGGRNGYINVSIRYGTDDSTIVTRRIQMAVTVTSE